VHAPVPHRRWRVGRGPLGAFRCSIYTPGAAAVAPRPGVVVVAASTARALLFPALLASTRRVVPGRSGDGSVLVGGPFWRRLCEEFRVEGCILCGE